MEFGASAVVGSALALLASAHLARALGVASFGQFNMARTVGEYLLLVISFGFTLAGTRAIIADPASRDVIVVRTTTVRLVLSLLTLAAVCIYCVWSRSPGASLIAIVAVSVVCSSLVMDWVYSALGNMRLPSIARVLGRAAYAAVVVVLVRSATDQTIAAWALVLEAALLAVVLIPGLRIRLSARIVKDALAGTQRMVRSSWRLGLAQAARQLKTNVDILLIAVLSTPLALGYYSAAYRLVLLVNMLAVLYATVLMPDIAHRYEGGGEWRRSATIGVRASILGSCVVIGVLAPVSPRLLVTLFGPEYRPAGAVMAVLMCAAAPLFLSAALGNIAVAIGKPQVFARTAVAAAVLNLLTNLVLIPRFGITGAAITTLITEVALAVTLVVILWRDGVDAAFAQAWWVRAAGVALLSAATAVAVLSSGGMWPAAVTASCVVLVLVSLATKLVSGGEMRALMAGGSPDADE